jgi:hypothetical protein
MPLLSPIHATCPYHLILLDFITRNILGEEYKDSETALIIRCGLLTADCWLNWGAFAIALWQQKWLCSRVYCEVFLVFPW